MADFETRLTELVNTGSLPGSVLFARDRTGRLNWAKAVGQQSLEPGHEEPMQLDTIFKLASTSKLLTTIAVLQIVDKGMVGLDDDVAQYVPVLAQQEILVGFGWFGWPRTKKRTNPITLRGLLTHTAGTGYDFLTDLNLLWKYRAWKKQPVGAGEHIDDRLGYPLLHEPGQGWTYGSGVTWAGKVLEKVTGMSLGEWIKKHMCEPLGLTSITFNPFQDPATASRVASVAWRDKWTSRLMHLPGHNLPETDKECLGGEGLYASLQDYMEVLYSLLMDDERILSKKTAAMMFEAQLDAEGEKAVVDYLEKPCWICHSILKKDEYNWGLGGALISSENYDYLKKGTLLWSGLLHLFWWIDREAGVCGIFGTQLLPGTDSTGVPMIASFQKAVYGKMEHIERPVEEKKQQCMNGKSIPTAVVST